MQNATFACWDEFDFSDTENDLPNLPRTTISDGSTPWNHFQDIVIGQRYFFQDLIWEKNFFIYFLSNFL